MRFLRDLEVYLWESGGWVNIIQGPPLLSLYNTGLHSEMQLLPPLCYTNRKKIFIIYFNYYVLMH